MIQQFEPFTPKMFEKETGLSARDNEAIYIRWVNAQINYANFQAMQQMAATMKEILYTLKNPVVAVSQD